MGRCRLIGINVVGMRRSHIIDCHFEEMDSMKSKIVVCVFAAMALGRLCHQRGTYDQKVKELSACQDERLAARERRSGIKDARPTKLLLRY